jgi:hypothetical protein
MKKVFLVCLVLVLTCALAGIASAGSLNIGNHFNLNIIGFANCVKNGVVDPDCYKGAGDASNGHTIFVPLKTAQTEDLCGSGSIMPTEMYDIAWLQKGVRILVSDDGGSDLRVVDRDATDGQAKLNLPDGCYNIYARALGKPGGCMDIDTVICYDTDDGGQTYYQVNCTLSNDKYVVVGHLDVNRIKGTKASWQNATSALLPYETGVGNGEAGYFDFFWQIFNQNLRLLQLRIDAVPCE